MIRRRSIPALIWLALVLCLFAGCGGKERSSPELAVCKSTPVLKKVADDGAPAPQPIRCWGQIRGDDVEFHWVDGTRGDFNRDGITNGQDLFLLATRFDKPTDYDLGGPGQEQDFDNCVDGNRDGVINGLDLFTLAANFGAKATQFEIYDSYKGGEYALISAEPVERPIDAAVCLPEFTLTIEGAASEGLHRFAIVASNDETTPAPQDGSPVVIDVPPAWCYSGLDADSIWPTGFHDQRQTAISPYTGPREFDAARIDRDHYPLSRDQTWGYIGFATDESGNAYLAPSLNSANSSQYELEKFSLRENESIWTIPAESTVSNTLQCAILTDRTIAVLVLRETSVSARLKRISQEGSTELDFELFNVPERNYEYSGDLCVTCSGNLMLYRSFDNTVVYACYTPTGELLWEFPVRKTAGERSRLMLPPDKIVIFDNGKLSCLRESDGEVLWDYRVHDPIGELYYQTCDMVADDAGDIFLKATWVDIGFGSEQYYGHFDSDGNDIEIRELGNKYYTLPIPLGDHTALTTLKDGQDGIVRFQRVTLDDLSPLWSIEFPDWVKVTLVDAEHYSYLNADGRIWCIDPDGNEVWTGSVGKRVQLLTPEHSLWAFGNPDPISLDPRNQFYNR